MSNSASSWTANGSAGPASRRRRSRRMLTTPTGMQAMGVLRRRRLFVLALNVVTYAGLLYWLAAYMLWKAWSTAGAA